MSRLTDTLAQTIHQPVDARPVDDAVKEYRQRIERAYNDGIIQLIHIKLVVRELGQRAPGCVITAGYDTFDRILAIGHDRHDDGSDCRNRHEHIFGTVIQMECTGYSSRIGEYRR